MAERIVMPRLGWTMEEGTLVEWLKQDGDEVQVGEIICTIESDKALNEIESFESGVLRIPHDSPPTGLTVPVGTLLAYVVQPGEASPNEGQDAAQAAAQKGLPPAAPSPEHLTSQVSAQAPRPSASTEVAMGAEPAITPRARRLAAELGVDWRRLKGSDGRRRIAERDVRAAAQASVSTPEHVDGSPGAPHTVAAAALEASAVAPMPTSGEARPLTQVRRRIAQHMTESAFTTAAVTLTTEADATELVARRDTIKASLLSKDVMAPTYGDLIVKLSAEALREHRLLNASWQDGNIIIYDSIHVGIAVDTEDGLVVPVIRDVLDKSLSQIAAESNALTQKARTRKLDPDDLSGGTFTITNLGMYGIDAFTPIINLQQCAILGVGRIISKPAVHDDQVVPRKMVTLSLTFDHRVVDGGPAGRFLNTLREYLEQSHLE